MWKDGGAEKITQGIEKARGEKIFITGYRRYVNRWVQNIDMTGIIVIQKRVAYFDCTVVLDDSFAALSRVGLPSFALPASLVRPRLRHGMVGVFGWRRNFGGLILKMNAHRCHRNR